MANIKSAKKRILVNRTKAARNKAIRSAVKTSIKKVEVAVANNDAEADDILKKGDDLKNKISALRKHQMNHMQEADNRSLKASMVYLNILQETQELVSVWRHLLRASRFFQGDYVPQEIPQMGIMDSKA